MSDKAWKAFERRISKIFPGATRRGTYTGSKSHGKPDLICEGWSVECKLLSRPSFQDILDAAYQAEANAEKTTDIPVAVIKRKGDLDVNSLVVMRLAVFEQLFINSVEEPNGQNLE